jgi:hypothetical protein
VNDAIPHWRGGYVETNAARTMTDLLSVVPTGDVRRARRGRRHGAAGVGPPELGGSHLGSARTLGACLDLELDALAADEPVKIQ